MTTPAEYETKPCSFSDCPGKMVLTMRAVSGGTHPSPGWVCGKNPDHVEWVFGLAMRTGRQSAKINTTLMFI